MRGRALVLAALGAATLVTLAYGGQSLARVWQMKHEVESLEREIGTLRARDRPAHRRPSTASAPIPTSSSRWPARIWAW